MSEPCDKCGKPVDAANDAVNLDMEVNPSLGLITAQPRHLLPEGDCPGSPSRAQYLEGQPRDPRYGYDEAYESVVRRGYERMQQRYGKQCDECGCTPVGEGCYHICPNSTHYYSPEQERYDDMIDDGSDDMRERYAGTEAVFDDERDGDFPWDEGF